MGTGQPPRNTPVAPQAKPASPPAPPVVRPGEPIAQWMGRAVPILVQNFQLSQEEATQLAQMAWQQVNGEKPMKASKQPHTGWNDEIQADDDAFGWDDPQTVWGEPLADVADDAAFGDPVAAEEDAGATADTWGQEEPAEERVSVWFGGRLREYAQMLSANLVSEGRLNAEQAGQINAVSEMLGNLLGEQIAQRLGEEYGPATATLTGEEETTDGEAQAAKDEDTADTDVEAEPEAEANVDAETEDDDPPPAKKKAPPFAASKAATLTTLFESEIHRNFTLLADNLYCEGKLSRPERITFSSCIGEALRAFIETANTKLGAETLLRAPYQDAPSVDFDSKPPPATTAWDDATKAVDEAVDDNGERQAEEDREMPATESALRETSEAQPTTEAKEIDALSQAVKAVGKNRIGGYLMLWGDRKATDLEGEYFTAKTAELRSIFDALGGLPVIYHHAIDNTLKSTVVGVIDTMKADEVGMWVEAQIRNHKTYRTFIQPLIRQNVLGWSSGALPQSKETDGDGWIKRWATVEGSLTPTPMDWHQVERPIQEIKGWYAAAGLDGAKLTLPEV